MSVSVIVVTVGEEEEISVSNMDLSIRIEMGPLTIYLDKKRVPELINKLINPDEDPYIIF